MKRWSAVIFIHRSHRFDSRSSFCCCCCCFLFVLCYFFGCFFFCFCFCFVFSFFWAGFVFPQGLHLLKNNIAWLNPLASGLSLSRDVFSKRRKALWQNKPSQTILDYITCLTACVWSDNLQRPCTFGFNIDINKMSLTNSVLIRSYW